MEAAERYVFSLTTKEVKKFNDMNKISEISEEKDGILYFNGRVLDEGNLKNMTDVMIDLSPLHFCKPIVDRYSPVAYSVMVHIHQKITNHGSVPTMLRESRGIVYCLSGRDLAKEVRKGCNHCRRYKQRMVRAEMGPVHRSRLTIAPAFYFAQIDLFGPYKAKCEHSRHRATVKVWGCVIKCPATLAISVHAMAGYDTDSFLQAYSRHVNRYGHPGCVFIDPGSQLMSAFDNMDVACVDFTKSANGVFGTQIKYEVCPVGSHEGQGLVERSILEVKNVFKKVFQGLELDILSYETAFSYAANQINCLPICLGSKTDELGGTDLITPSRLILGKNNLRAAGCVTHIDKPGKLMEQLLEVEAAWWQVWHDEKLVDFIPSARKWRVSDDNVKVGDVVIFIPTSGQEKLCKTTPWRTGEVVAVKESDDGIVRQVEIQYKNASESVFRKTWRSVRKIAIVHSEDDIDLITKLNDAAKQANILFMSNHK